MTARAVVRQRLAEESARPAGAHVLAVAERVAARLAPHAVAVLYYGSCRRNGVGPDAVIDLHVVVDDLSAAVGRVGGWLGRWLPPNVYYLEQDALEQDALEQGALPRDALACDAPSARLRAKYAVLSERELRRACAGRRFHSYLWGRYAQPVSIVWTRAPADRERVLEALTDAVGTFLARVVPTLEAPFTALDAFEHGLGWCYRAELRAEGGHRAAELVAADASHYAALAPALTEAGGRRRADGRFEALCSRRRRWAAYGSWWLRVVAGKPLSLARLLKALATFDGGLDYIVWKLERHSGRRIELPERVRRRPLVHLWPLLWRLWRQGVFR